MTHHGNWIVAQRRRERGRLARAFPGQFPKGRRQLVAVALAFCHRIHASRRGFFKPVQADSSLFKVIQAQRKFGGSPSPGNSCPSQATGQPSQSRLIKGFIYKVTLLKKAEIRAILPKINGLWKAVSHAN